MAIKKARKIVEVLFSDERVVASEAQSVIPTGYRQATLEEVALSYRYVATFIQKLHDIGPAWTSKKRLKSSEYQQIHDDGSQSKIDRDTYYSLPPEKRSYHYPGSGSVAVGVYDYDDWNRRLSVDADVRASDGARVAYVKAEPSQRVSNGAEYIPKKIVSAAEKQLAQLEGSPLINQGQVSALRTLVDVAKRQKRQ